MTAGQSAAGRDVESINEEAVEAVKASLWDERFSDRDEQARAALAAALPLLRLSDVPGLERQLRDKIAGEIEAEHAVPVAAPDNHERLSVTRWNQGIATAARIARGKVSS